jgi:hypothetical protein
MKKWTRAELGSALQLKHGEEDGVGSKPFASNCVRLRCYSRLETSGMEAKNYAFDKRHRI